MPIPEDYSRWLDPDDYEFIEKVRLRGHIGGGSLGDLNPTIYGSWAGGMAASADYCKAADRTNSPFFNDALLDDLLREKARIDHEVRRINWKNRLKTIRQRRAMEKARAEARREWEERRAAMAEAKRKSDEEWERQERLWAIQRMADEERRALERNQQLLANDKQSVLAACQRIYFQDGQQPTAERIAAKLGLDIDRVRVALSLLTQEGKVRRIE